jgi:hypothetical protein
LGARHRALPKLVLASLVNKDVTQIPQSDEAETKGELKQLSVVWDALEDAFENNAPDVHSYLNLSTGDVVRLVDGAGDYTLEQRIRGDSNYLLIDPVSSREQYRWMERFIESTENPDVQDHLLSAIDGKGAFRRFKDVLMEYPVERERWFTFRSERLRQCIETWLENHGIRAVERPEWTVPTADEIVTTPEALSPAPASTTVEKAKPAPHGLSGLRQKCKDLIEQLAPRDLDFIVNLLELTVSKHQARTRRAPSRSGTVAIAQHEDQTVEEAQADTIAPTKATGSDER